MSEKELKDLLQEAYYAGKANATNRTDKNLNDFLGENRGRIKNYSDEGLQVNNIPSKDEVIDAVIDGIFIRGIELEDYRRELENGDLFEKIQSLYCGDK